MKARLPACLMAAVAAATLVSCIGGKRPATKPSDGKPGASLWSRPGDLASRDLFHGPWGASHAPAPGAVYKLVERKRTGVNPGMDVVDAEGREWAVKQPSPGDSEVEIEIALSRLLSAIGYHQTPVYFLPRFTLEDAWGRRIETGGRFRLKERSLKSAGDWSWQENPFIGTRPYGGLLALMMMFNSTDLKNSNNSIYERRDGHRVDHWYVVRDLGAALGDTHRVAPLKGDPAAFEREPFILGVGDGYVRFAYDGWFRSLVRNRVAPADVAWASDLLGGLTDRQWHDAFRAGGFEPAAADRFIRKLREKVEQGRALRP